jgi:hypothetical protein
LWINGGKIIWFEIKRLILHGKRQPLNQRVQGSSPCAPTNDFNWLGKIKIEPPMQESAALVMRLAALVFSSPIAMWKLQNEFRVLPTPHALLGAVAAAAND